MVASHVADRQSSSWSMYERIRIEERFQATLAGIIELDMLKVKYKAIVQAALESSDQDFDTDQKTTFLWKQRQHGQCEYQQQAQDLSSLTDKIKDSPALRLAQSASQNVVGGADRTYSFQPQTETDRISRTSSGFYDMDSRSLLNSQSSLNVSVSAGSHLDLSSIPYCHMDSGVSLGCTKTTKGRSRPFSTGDLDMLKNFLSNAELYPKSRWSMVGTILQPHFHLNPKFQLDLVSGSTGEVYRFPSPLHAIALQSPLFTAAERHSLAQSLSGEDTKRVPSLTNEHLAGEQQSWTCTFKSSSRPAPRPASGLDFDYQSNERSRPSDEYIFKLVLKYQQRNATSNNQQHSWFTSASRKSISVSSLASAGGALACSRKLQKQVSTSSMIKSFHRHHKSPNFQTCQSDVSTFGRRSSLLSNSFPVESELNFIVNKVGSTADLVSPERHYAFVSNNCSSDPEMCLDFPVLGSRRTSFGDTFHKVSGKQRSRRLSQQKWMSLLEVSSLNHDKVTGERIFQRCPGCSTDTKPLSGLRYAFKDGHRAFSKDSLSDKVFGEDELITDFYGSKPNLSGEEEESDHSSLGISSTCSVSEPSENFNVNKEAAQRPKVFSSLRLFSFNGNSSKK